MISHHYKKITANTKLYDTHHSFRSLLWGGDISYYSCTETDVSLAQTSNDSGHHEDDKAIGDGPDTIGNHHTNL